MDIRLQMQAIQYSKILSVFSVGPCYGPFDSGGVSFMVPCFVYGIKLVSSAEGLIQNWQVL